MKTEHKLLMVIVLLVSAVIIIKLNKNDVMEHVIKSNDKQLYFSHYASGSAGEYWEYELSTSEVIKETKHYRSGLGYNYHWVFTPIGEGNVTIDWKLYEAGGRNQNITESYSITYYFDESGNHTILEDTRENADNNDMISPTLIEVTKAPGILYQEDGMAREEIIEPLSVTPTPGPEPYSVFDTEKDINIGDVVIMGNYAHQDSEVLYEDADGNKYDIWSIPVKWLVLDKVDGKALLLALYNVDVIAFDEGKQEKTTWETSTLRSWLNGKFRESAFDEKEQECIAETVVRAEANPLYGTEGGVDSRDFIFVLSVEETERYLKKIEERKTQIEPPVNKEKIDWSEDIPIADTTDFYGWWLRTPGENEKRMAYVSGFGEIHLEGALAGDSWTSVRPAMWVDLNKVKEVGFEKEEEK